MPTIPSPHLSPAEAADYLGLSIKSVRRLISTGDLPARRIGRLIRIRVEDLDTLGRPLGPGAR